MDFPETSWLADTDFESSLNEQTRLTMNSPIDLTGLLMMEDDGSFDDIHESWNKLPKPSHYSSFPSAVFPDPDQIRGHNNNNHMFPRTPIILNFENRNLSPHDPITCPQSRALNPDEQAFVAHVLMSDDNINNKDQLRCVEAKKPSPKRRRIRLPLQNYDHILAERNRRQQISQKFLALSTVVPGLKKCDKASVLGDAIAYMKHLQDKVKILEEQAAKHAVESFVIVKKSKATMLSEADDEIRREHEKSLPKIEARLCRNQIMFKIQCERRKGVLVNLHDALENHLRLNVFSTDVSSFGSFVLDVTIVAEMETGYDLTVQEAVKRLRRVSLGPSSVCLD